MPNENEVQSLVINTSPITVEEQVANKNTQKLSQLRRGLNYRINFETDRGNKCTEVVCVQKSEMALRDWKRDIIVKIFKK